MAHRALVAYADGEGFRLHYAHWGEGIADDITPERPFGGRSNRGRERTLPPRLADRFDLAPAGGYGSATRVDPRPLARVGPTDLLAALDATVESLVVVTPTVETRTYVVCPLGLDGGGPLVLVGPTDDAAAVRETLVTLKQRLGERVDAGALDTERARAAIRRTLARYAPVHALDDASFLRTD